MTVGQDYILGTDDEELARLGLQHEAWRERTYALWRRAGFGAGDALLDAGCGPGFCTLDLAGVVGPTGRVLGRDKSAKFLEVLARESERRGLAQVETGLANLEQLELPRASLDGAYSRWTFSWLARPETALARIVEALRPGGVYALQEYLDWAAMRLIPTCESFDRAVDACMRSWREGGATIDVALRLPQLAAGAGLRLEALDPVARIGPVGSFEWRWLGSFFAGYLPKLVSRGSLRDEERLAFDRTWRARTEEGASFVITPTVADVLLRKPAAP